jgi:hypothetical protein
VGDGVPLTAGTAEFDAEVDDRTGPVQVDVPVPGNGTVTAPNDPVSGNGHGNEHSQARLWAALRTAPLPALLLAVLLAIGAGVVGWNLNSAGTPVYSSRTVMSIDQPYGIATAGDEGILLKLVTLRIKYQGLASTDAIAGPVATKLGLPITDVLSATSVVLPADSLLLVVTATWTNGDEAQRLSSAVAAEITSYVKSENAQYVVPAADQFLIHTVDPTTRAAVSTPSHRKSAADAIGLALVTLIISFVVAQLIFNRRLLTA